MHADRNKVGEISLDLTQWLHRSSTPRQGTYALCGRGSRGISSHKISIRSNNIAIESGSLSTICGVQGAIRRAAHHVDIDSMILVVAVQPIKPLVTH